MKWDKNKKYTIEDYYRWKRMGYRRIELDAGVPYQEGSTFFEKEPLHFPPEMILRILSRIYFQFVEALKDSPYQVYLFYPVVLDGESVLPDLVVLDDKKMILLVGEIPESDKYMRQEQCENEGVAFWKIWPEDKLIVALPWTKKCVYETGQEIPIADTGLNFFLSDVWEDPIV